MMSRIAAATILAVGSTYLIPATTAAASDQQQSCPTVVVRQTVAVHYDPNFTSRVVRTAPAGEHDTTCLTAIGRGDPYRACGHIGYDWYLIKNGFIPDVCASKGA
ncbi:hypothetical protein [Actinacidiphila reveromycinica]|nr:hypothetical protein [Streptomyces sp. SN-593]